MKKQRYYNNMQRKEIPIFFASDDNYVPYMAVALNSLIKNASKNYDYKIKILTTGISEENMAKLKKMERSYVDIDFVDVKKSLSELKVDLHTRDYYTNTTYFRLFIPDLFPQYKKALYLDGDI
ncbi:MAG: glycosyltransferase family 8 protein, partial [Clostridia bacterium]|nr:glycosyltransferase family 8 protein [Clostridia bacterium]